MGDAGFYRGTNSDQDGRFSDKEKKLLRTMKFEDALERKINRSKINLDVIKPWVVMRLNEMLGIDDDVITEYVFTQLEEPELNPKIIQINITGFLNARRAREFMGELWSLLIEAEESEDGIPKSLIEKKLSELHSRDFDKKQAEKKDNIAIKTAENDWKHRYTSLSGGVYTGPMIKRERDDRIYTDKDRERPRDDARDNVRDKERNSERDRGRDREQDRGRDREQDRGRDRDQDRGRDREQDRDRDREPDRDRDRERPRREREVRRSEERRDRGDRDREHRRDDRDKRDERRESRKDDEEKRDVKRKKRSRSRSRSRSPRRKFREGPADKEKKHHDSDGEKKRKKAKKEKKKSKRRSSSSSSASD